MSNKKSKNLLKIKEIFINLLIEEIFYILYLFLSFKFNCQSKISIFKNKLLNYTYFISIVLVIITLISYLNYIIKNKKKKKEGLKKYSFDLILQILLNFTNYVIIKYVVIKLYLSKYENLVRKDLLALENFVKNNKEIKSADELLTKTKDLLEIKFSFKNDYVYDENFLFIRDIDIIYYYLAKYPEDCSYYDIFSITLPSKPFIIIKESYTYQEKITNKEQSIRYIQKIINDVCENKRFIFLRISLGIDGKNIRHAVIFILDNSKKTVEYFDPNILQYESEQIEQYTYDYDKIYIPNIMKDYFKGYQEIPKNFADSFIKEFGTNDVYGFKRIGLQDLDDEDERGIEKGGYCVDWTWFYLDERLKKENRDLTQTQIIEKLIRKWNADKDKKSYVSFIRSVSVFNKAYSLIVDNYKNYFTSFEIANIAKKVFTSS